MLKSVHKDIRADKKILKQCVMLGPVSTSKTGSSLDWIRSTFGTDRPCVHRRTCGDPIQFRFAILSTSGPFSK